MGPQEGTRTSKGIDMHLADERLWLKILLIGCPFHHADKACPLHELRLLPPTDAHEAIATMTRAQVSALLAHHKACHADHSPALGQAG
jgi:hypothetical protein